MLKSLLYTGGEDVRPLENGLEFGEDVNEFKNLEAPDFSEFPLTPRPTQESDLCIQIF